MEKRIKDLFNKNGNWDFIDKLEQKLGYGIEVLTERSCKVIHKADETKNIIIQIRVQNKTEYKIIQSKIMRGIGTFRNTEMKSFIILDERTNDYYGKHTGLTNKSIRDTDKDFIISYNSEQMKKIPCLKAEYEQRVKAYKQIGELFNIDCEQYYCHEIIVARVLAGKCLRCFNGGEHVTIDEYDYVDGACQGGLTYCDKGIFENCIKCDLNSAYPYCMQREDFIFPITIGKIQHVNKIDKSKLGIYKLKINETHYLFKPTPKNYYTSYHVEILDLLGLDYELVDSKDNAIIWDEGLKGNHAFGYMNYLYDLKKNGNKYVKSIMNVTWGSLSREKITEIPWEDVTEEMRPYVRDLDLDRKKALVMLDNCNSYGKEPHPYKFVTGRIKPFITSFVRLYFIKCILLPVHKDYKIYQINTDGFITNATKEQNEKFYPFGNDLGDLKVEQEYKKCEIVHLRKIVAL